MLIDHSREKLLNSIIYFASNTKFCGKIKLFKLLYFLDFEHYSNTGRNVTGLEYYAWPMGPVPKDLHNELENPDENILEYVALKTRKTANGNAMLDIKPRARFLPDFFSKRELKIMKSLCDEYKDSYSKDMIEATHLENLPWHEIYEKRGLKQNHIPYELALKKAEIDQILKNVTEHDEFKGNYE